MNATYIITGVSGALASGVAKKILADGGGVLLDYHGTTRISQDWNFTNLICLTKIKLKMSLAR